MPISVESQNVLSELQKAGVDPAVIAGLQRELDTKPDADKIATNMLLAQKSFNSYKSSKEQEITDLKNNLTKLSNLQGAAKGLDGDLQQAALDQIAALEQVMVAQGYSLEEVRAEAAKLVTDPEAVKRLTENKVEKKEVLNANGNGLDEKTVAELLRVSGNNIAAGGMQMATKIAAALRQADKLGIELTDEQINELPNIIIKGFEQNQAPEVSIDKHLGFSTKLAENAETKRKAELATEREAGRQEALKEKGVTLRKNTSGSNDHPVLSRVNHAIGDRKPVERKRFSEVTQDDIDKLPENKAGDKEIFRLRANDEFERREKHTTNATERWEKERLNYDDDGRYIGHEQQQQA